MAIHPSRRAFVSAAATSLLVPLGEAGAAGARMTGKAAAGADFLQSGAGAVARTTQSKLDDIISVKDFGAKGDGVTDDSAAFQAAIDVVDGHANTYTSIYLPPGDYRLTNTIRLNKRHIRIYGAGDKSCLFFDPPSAGRTMLLVQDRNRAELINYIALEDFGFRASPRSRSYAKTGIRLVDASIVTIRNVNVTDYSWTSGGTSIGIHMEGRDNHQILGCAIVADKPIYAGRNPNSAKYTFDYNLFRGLWLQTLDPRSYAITFAPGVNPSNWVVDGNCAALTGKGGIYLNNAGARADTPSMISIDSLRIESGTASGGSAGGYGIYMDFGTGNPTCGNIWLKNCSVNDPACNGFFFKNVAALVVDNVNCGFGPANNAFILTDVLGANIRSLGIGHDTAVVQFNDMYAQHVVKPVGAHAHAANPSVAFGVYTHYDTDAPSRNLVYRNGERSWQRTERLRNRGEMALPALAAGGSMLVFVSSGLGGAVYALTHSNSFLLNATPGWEAAVGIVSDGTGNSKLVNRSADTQIFTVNTNGT